MTVLYVALGGALGSAARFLPGAYIARFTTPASPLGTFSVNFLLIGVLGGFTTFSSYTYETFELSREGLVFRALANALGQMIACLVALWVGFAIVRSL
jgi:CrcB protein